MSLDGIAFTNLGFYRPVEPSELAQQANKASREHAEKVIQEVENLDQIKLNPDEKQKKQNENSSKKEKEKETSDENTEIQESKLEDKQYLNQYEVKYNNVTNMVELVDRITQRVIETIKPEDLVSLITKSKGYSGILVDRKV